MALDDTIIIVALAVVAAIAIVACAALILLMRRRPKQPITKSSREPEINSFLSPVSGSSLRVTKTVQATDATRAKDELRILDLEREILADAIRRLYEAHAEGKITELEREKLAGSYKSRMMSVKDSMAKDENIVALHELESMQEDLMKLFSERFGEITGKVDELRTRIDARPIKEIRVPMPRQQAPVPDQMEKEEQEDVAEEKIEAENREKNRKVKKPPAEKQKTEAEQRIDAIRSQIDDVMNKLGQMEMES